MAAALSTALAVGTREAFEELLTDDVRWGGEHGGNECHTRTEAGDHYAGLLAAGVRLRIVDLIVGDERLTARLHVAVVDSDALPAEVTIRLTLRDGRIADIRELDPPPTVELLFFDGCPHYDAFLPHLRQLLDRYHPTAPITEINIATDEDAQQHRFLGSPTLRVNGRDVDPAAAGRDGYGLQCRIYATPDGTTGTPADQWITNALVGKPADAEAVDAIRTGNVAALQQLLRNHPDLATARLTRHGGRTLLHIATDWPGHFPNVAATIAALVARGADPDAASLGEHPETPLHWAASSDDVEAIDALLDAGANVDVTGAVIGGGSPLADATAFGQWAAARRLVERGARVTFWEAAALGLLGQVQQHVDQESPSVHEITSSFWGACHGGQLETAKYLLDLGADLNWIGFDDHTPRRRPTQRRRRGRRLAPGTGCQGDRHRVTDGHAGARSSLPALIIAAVAVKQDGMPAAVEPAARRCPHCLKPLNSTVSIGCCASGKSDPREPESRTHRAANKRSNAPGYALWSRTRFAPSI
jgi:hypothetical protein